MKIRRGFVSNSSSSSFVLVTSVANWEKVKKELHPFEVAVAEKVAAAPVKFCGEEVVCFRGWYDRNDSSNFDHYCIDGAKDYMDTDESIDWIISEAWHVVQKQLKKNKGQVLFVEQDW